ncbi:MAG: hypothetical protein QXR09_01695 [Candidatus Aenigmatarchaeota archaeon]
MKYLLLILILFLFSFKLVSSLNLTCEVGGPYGTGSTIIVVGNVTGYVSNITSITIEIIKEGTLKVSRTTSSDTTGTYFSIFTQSFDIGSYIVNVTATNSTHTATCIDTFDVIPQEVSKECQDAKISVSGIAYAEGKILGSGRAFISIEGLRERNTTNFSNSEFSLYLSACLHKGKRYLLQISILDEKGGKGTIYIPFIPT